MEPQEFSEFAASRHTTRDFLSTPVPQNLIDEIITDGLTSPSWSNTRPIVVAVATGEVRDRISAEYSRRGKKAAALLGTKFGKLKLFLGRDAMPTSNPIIPKPYVGELLTRSRKVGFAIYNFLGIDRKDRAARDRHWFRNYEFFGAPVELFIFNHKSLGKYSANDAGLFVMNLMLSAHARGLGTCAQGVLGVYEDIVRAEFDVPEDYEIMYGVALGYPSDSKVNKFAAERYLPSDITAKSVHRQAGE